MNQQQTLTHGKHQPWCHADISLVKPRVPQGLPKAIKIEAVRADSGYVRFPGYRSEARARQVAKSGVSPEALAADQLFGDKLSDLIPFLRSCARRLCGPFDMVDDLAQDAMMLGWAARSSFTPGTNFKAWMFTILRNQFYTLIRKEKRMARWEPEVAESELVEAPAQEGVIHLADVSRALGKLPAEQREVLLLVGAGGTPYKEAAEVIGCAIGTVKSRVARGRMALALLIDGPESLARFDKAA